MTCLPCTGPTYTKPCLPIYPPIFPLTALPSVGSGFWDLALDQSPVSISFYTDSETCISTVHSSTLPPWAPPGIRGSVSTVAVKKLLSWALIGPGAGGCVFCFSCVLCLCHTHTDTHTPRTEATRNCCLAVLASLSYLSPPLAKRLGGLELAGSTGSLPQLPQERDWQRVHGPHWTPERRGPSAIMNQQIP